MGDPFLRLWKKREFGTDSKDGGSTSIFTEALPDKIEFKGDFYWLHHVGINSGGHRISYASKAGRLHSSYIIFDKKDLQIVSGEMKRFKNIVTV